MREAHNGLEAAVRGRPQLDVAAIRHGARGRTLRQLHGRPRDQREPARRRHPPLPGSVHIPRTVLEWRVAPEISWRNPHLGALDRQLVILCDHGHSSSLAAATLVELGLNATDVIGGFEAWQETGLPVAAPAHRPNPGELAGMGPPEPDA